MIKRLQKGKREKRSSGHFTPQNSLPTSVAQGNFQGFLKKGLIPMKSQESLGQERREGLYRVSAEPKGEGNWELRSYLPLVCFRPVMVGCQPRP